MDSSEIEWAWNNFPMHIFAGSRGRSGEMTLLWPAFLCIMAVGILGMNRSEWASPRGALAIAALAMLILYLILPDKGFGGNLVKIRMSWTGVLLGTITALSTMKIRALRTPLSLYAGAFFAFYLLQAHAVNVRNTSDMVIAYRKALEPVRPGATAIRLLYNTDDSRKAYGVEAAALNPLYHADALVAAERKFIMLSDYQALDRIFPVRTLPKFSDVDRARLWGLEGVGDRGPEELALLHGELPVPIDYVVLVGDESDANLRRMVEELSHCCPN
ncbi:MAG: hypothetical protein ACK5AZ_26490 [Bryobacteraceae bacterium]